MIVCKQKGCIQQYLNRKFDWSIKTGMNESLNESGYDKGVCRAAPGFAWVC